MLDALHATWSMIQGLLLLGVCALLFQVVKQQGRLLLRLDRIDEALGIFGPAAQTSGLEVGTPIPEFRLPDLDGRMVSPEDLRGKRTLLVHWGPGCGFCEMIASDLAKLHGELAERDVRLVLASREDAKANRALAEEKGLKCPILLMTAGDSLTDGAFRNQGTPVAYLLDEQGRVARPLAVGGEAILSLAEQGMGEKPARKKLPGERPLSESRFVRDGIKAGTPAPAFRLPELSGETISLEDYRGRQVLLIFTDPHCGPCDELAPHLAKLQHECRDEGLELIVVGRGDADENRRKAEKNGFDFPIVLQDRWKLSQEYGIFAVPVAFLINEDGVTAANVGQGVDQILVLLRQGLASGKVSNGRSVRG